MEVLEELCQEGSPYSSAGMPAVLSPSALPRLRHGVQRELRDRTGFSQIVREADVKLREKIKTEQPNGSEKEE